jgi:hypothetical protein
LSPKNLDDVHCGARVWAVSVFGTRRVRYTPPRGGMSGYRPSGSSLVRRAKYAPQRMDLCGMSAGGGGDVTEGRLNLSLQGYR